MIIAYKKKDETKIIKGTKGDPLQRAAFLSI